jgi:hypothetical protein
MSRFFIFASLNLIISEKKLSGIFETFNHAEQKSQFPKKLSKHSLTIQIITS